MNKEWSLLNKNMQQNISKRNTFLLGIKQLLELRKELFDMVMMVHNSFPNIGYSLQPLANSDGYDSKTMAYSIYHIARIEDIVCHTIMNNDCQIFFKNKYNELLNSDIITTGNELKGDEIKEFSTKLNINVLHDYFKDVYEASNAMINNLKYEDLKIKVADAKDRVIESKCVSDNLDAYWLIDYWCSKDYLGLLKMPFSRHWIMHIEALLRIKNTIISKEKKRTK